MVFAYIYICPHHGETIDVYTYEAIDCDNDEVYAIMMCSTCHSEVKPLLDENGKQVMRPLTEEEMEADLGFDDDPDWDEDEWSRN